MRCWPERHRHLHGLRFVPVVLQTSKTETITSDAAGTLLVPVKALGETTRRPSEAWDGADCILLIGSSGLSVD